jgi:hypothetical protein
MSVAAPQDELPRLRNRSNLLGRGSSRSRRCRWSAPLARVSNVVGCAAATVKNSVAITNAQSTNVSITVWVAEDDIAGEAAGQRVPSIACWSCRGSVDTLSLPARCAPERRTPTDTGGGASHARRHLRHRLRARRKHGRLRAQRPRRSVPRSHARRDPADERLHRAAARNPRPRRPRPHPVWSPEGAQIAYVGADRTVYVLDPLTPGAVPRNVLGGGPRRILVILAPAMSSRPPPTEGPRMLGSRLASIGSWSDSARG